MKKHILTKTIFFILLVIFTLLWLVNLEFAIKLFIPDLAILLKYIPANIHKLLETLSSDLSTVTTLIPALICLFPIISLNKLQKSRDTEISETFPYPENFPFFLVMLGLAGTLYGLLIGLDSSGLTTLGTDATGAPEIRETIDRLLDGTATALLSSLVGIIGAFIVVKPIPMIFHGLLGIKENDEDDIEQVIHNLTIQFNNLNKVVEDFSTTIEKYNDTNIPQSVQNIEKAFFKLLEQQSINTEFLQHIHKQQELTNKLLEPLANLEKLAILSQIYDKIGKLDKLDNINDKLDRLVTLEKIDTNQTEQLELSKLNNTLVTEQTESAQALKASVEKIPAVITQILKQDKEFHDKTETTNSEILNNIIDNGNKNKAIIDVLKDSNTDKEKQRNKILKNIKTYIDSF
ncbi:MAG: hypothetical protein PF692_04220 [Kiritimatiellae bacterium]|jgi:hypothetical protein|nr:hypothetical protein [Kiritimatiellia bacterium]